MPIKTPPLRFVDVFAGCGGLSLGLSQAGLQGIFAVEHNSCAFETFSANLLRAGSEFEFDWPVWLKREPTGIEKLLQEHEDDLLALRGQVDLLVGGPPCQGFSSAGRRREDDPRNQLFSSYLKLVDLIRPKAVLIENVRGFTVDFNRGSSRQNYSAKLVEALSADYRVHDGLLNLSEFGIPQNRVRYFAIGFRKDLPPTQPFDILREILPSYLRELGLSVPVSSRSAISDLEVSRCGTRPSRDSDGFLEISHIGPLSRYQKLMASGNVETGDLRLAKHTLAVATRFAEIISLCHAEGRLNISVSDDMRARFGIKKRALRVLDPDSPAPTITSMPDDLLHYREPRILTVRENARLQSFPDWFLFKGKYTTGGPRRRHEVPRYTQVANAVPPLVAHALGLVLQQILYSGGRSRGLRSRKGIAELAEV